MRLLLLALIACSAAPTAYAQLAPAHPDPASPVGRWAIPNDDGGTPDLILDLYLAGGELRGRIVDTPRNPDAVCSKCEGDDKGRPLKGFVMITGLTRDGDRWTDGKLFAPDMGRTVNCSLWREGDDLRVQGRVGIFRRTMTWTRIDG